MHGFQEYDASSLFFFSAKFFGDDCSQAESDLFCIFFMTTLDNGSGVFISLDMGERGGIVHDQAGVKTLTNLVQAA